MGFLLRGRQKDFSVILKLNFLEKKFNLAAGVNEWVLTTPPGLLQVIQIRMRASFLTSSSWLCFQSTVRIFQRLVWRKLKFSDSVVVPVLLVVNVAIVAVVLVPVVAVVCCGNCGCCGASHCGCRGYGGNDCGHCVCKAWCCYLEIGRERCKGWRHRMIACAKTLELQALSKCNFTSCLCCFAGIILFVKEVASFSISWQK